jgi:2-amino-4-hydroxy-6-hydroxymethyldihydropteridine diphosphokinase
MILLRDAVTAYVSLGANLGQPDLAVLRALDALVATAGVCEVRASSLYRSAPVDAGGPWYCNAVAEVRTRLTAPELLAVLQALENAAGRERPYRNAPRTLDLDLLLYGTASLDSPALIVPHPRMRQRAFVLLPLRELAPERVSMADLTALDHQAIEPWPGAGP